MLVSNSYAEWNWTKLVESDEQTTYIDLSRIKSVSNIRYFYELKDYTEPEQGLILSHIVYSKINCNTNMQWILQVQQFKLAMGKGESDIFPNEMLSNIWEPYTGRYADSMLNLLCRNY